MPANRHPLLRVILILFIMLSFDVIAALAASCARTRLDYPPTMIALIAMVTIVVADLVFLYLLLVKMKRTRSGENYYGSFEELVQKYYDGSNWDAAFKKAYDEWHDPFRRR